VGRFESFVLIASMKEGSAETLLKTRGLGVIYTIERAKQLDIRRLIHISSISIHGRVLTEVVHENTSVTHSLPVGTATWASGCFISNERSSIQAISIRSPAIAGPYASRHFLAKIFLDMHIGSGEISVSNPNKLYNSMATLEAVADFTNHFLLSDLNGKHLANIGAKEPLTVSLIAEFLKSCLKSESVISTNKNETNCYLIDNTAAINLGYQAPTVQETLNYYSKKSGWI